MIIGLSPLYTLLTGVILLLIVFIYAKNIKLEIMGPTKLTAEVKEQAEHSAADCYQSRRAS